MIDAPLLLLPHNPEEPAKQRLSWKTEVLIARDGTEQRRKLRSKPLERLTYHITLINADEHAQVVALLWNAEDLRVGIPRWQDVVLLALPGAIAGDTVLSANDDAEIRFGAGPAVLWIEGVGYEEIVIDSVVGNTVTLSAPIVDSWPAGTSLLPITIGYAASPVDGETYGQLKGNLTVAIDRESDVAGVTDGGESTTMVPASIALALESGGIEGQIAQFDVQAVMVDVFDGAGVRIPDPDITITNNTPLAIRVYPTGQPGIYNVKNLGSGADSGNFDVTSGSVTENAVVGLE